MTRRAGHSAAENRKEELTMEEKTNVLRMFDKHKLPYTARSYDPEETRGEEVARLVGLDPASVFKTLVTVGASRANYVFVIPVCRELDLKKAAKAVGEKSVQMIKARELLPLTGYVHGGCSPVGMKKFFKTAVDRSAEAFPEIAFSAGKRGLQVQTSLASLARLIPFTLADLTE